MARQIIKHKFGGIAGGTARKQLGQKAFSEIAYGLSQQELPEIKDVEPNKTSPKPKPDFSGFGSGLDFEKDYSSDIEADLGLETLVARPTPPPQMPPPAAIPNAKGNPYSDPRSIGPLVSGLPHGPGPTESGQGQLGNTTASLGSLIGDVNVSRAGARHQIQQAGFRAPQLQQFGNVGATSPFKRKTVSFGNNQDTLAPIQGGSLAAGEISGAFAAGYNPAVERHNYKRQVWADKAAEADEEFGKLQVEPSGVSSWDASVELMAREWKGELAGLLKDKEKLDPNEFVQKKQDILARSQQFNTASQSLQKVVADYNENLDNVSASTDPGTMDLLNTLNKGGNIGVSNVDGVPTLSGMTNGGQEVSIPLGEIASGRNMFRFNTKKDIQKPLNNISNSLGKLRRDYATNAGVTTQAIPWEQLKDSAGSQIDALIKTNADVRGIWGDHYGIDFDQFNDTFKGDGDAARAALKEKLLADMEQKHQPQILASKIKRGGASGRGPTATQINNADKQQKAVKQAQGIAKQFDSFGTPGNEEQASGFARALQAFAPAGYEFQYQPGSKPGKIWGTNKDWTKSGVLKVADPDGNVSEIDLNNKEQVQQWILKISGVGQ